MPMYEYRCRDCEADFETLVMGDEEPTCPACDSVRLEKRLSVPGAPRVKEGAALPMACRSEGPPCGPACSRFGT